MIIKNLIKRTTSMLLMAMAMLFGFTPPVVAQEYIYELTDVLAAGEQYLIVNSNQTGTRYAIGHLDH